MKKLITSTVLAYVLVLTACDITSPHQVVRNDSPPKLGEDRRSDNPCYDAGMADVNMNCPTHIDPVCGCDGRTYNNRCEANRAGMYVQYKGFCNETEKTPRRKNPVKGQHPCFNQRMKDNHSGNCPAIAVPVCGCDGKTYSNACNANREGIRVVHVGPCKE